MNTPRPSLLTIILPGFLVAATGVGAGDLATASFTGSQLGLAVLWAVVVGGVLKFTLTEGLARWQLATGKTFLEGVSHHFSPVVGWLFLPYLLLWSFFVGSALISACGVTLHALFPVFEDPSQAKIVFGIVCSLAGLGLVLAGGFRLFEKTMSLCVGVMFLTVVATAILLKPNVAEVLSGLVIPTIPDREGSGISWTVALIGGVGGTLTILCYGYWIREKGRTDAGWIRLCRLDLAAGYGMTILFGLAMVIVGSAIQVDGKGAGLLVSLSQSLEANLGPVGRWVFLIGAFSAIFSSLLGVWQAVPYLFADIWSLLMHRGKEQAIADLTKTGPYTLYLFGIALVPMLGLFMGFREVQKLYSIIGALFMPMLALALLILNGRKAWVGAHTNKPLGLAALIGTLLFFASLAGLSWFR
jgi:Mn2+/Fe2+ NRAMP family transporter